MSVAKIVEISCGSKNSFEDAIETGIKRASKTLKGIRGAWVQDQEVVVKNDSVLEYRVRLKVTFLLDD